MIFRETRIPGAYVVEPERLEDERGFFARTWCRRELQAAGLESDLVQCSISFNPKKGTLRGMHYQEEPHGEAKLVRCTMGAVYDVLIDLRPESPAFRGWTALELDAANRTSLFVPRRVAHGFLTLAPNSEVLYQISSYYEPSAARGVRWDDPQFAVDWPMAPVLMSERDRSYADYQEPLP